MKKIVLTLVVFLIFTGTFFWREIFLGEVIYCCDNFLINVPAKAFLIEELKQGRFPLWNPYIFSGTPFFADLNNALLYPLNILYAFLEPFRALTAIIIINFIIVITGTYAFARSLKFSHFASLVSAVVFGFSGTMVVYTNNAPMLQVASLFPWVLWGINKNLLIAALIASLQIISGYPQLTYLTWLLVFAWQLTGSRPVRKLGVFIVLTFLLTAVQTLPFLEFVRLSTRAGGGYAYATFDSLHPLSIVRLIIPNVVGNLSEGFVIAQGGSVYGYVGVLALLLAFFANRKDKAVRFFIFSAIVSFALALGKYTPVYRIAYNLLPGLSGFRSPQHFLLLYTFSVAILAGFGAQQIVKTKSMQKIVVAVIFLELFAFSRNNLLSVPQAQVNDWLAEARNTAQKLQKNESILIDQKSFPNPYAKGKPFIDISSETAWQAKILRPNLNMLFKIPSYDGYASLVLKKYRDSINSDSKDPTGVDFRKVSIDKINIPSLDQEKQSIDRATQIGLFLSLVGAMSLTGIKILTRNSKEITE